MRMRQRLVQLHRYVGLVMAGFLIIAGLTGALLVWYYELDALINPQWLKVEPPAAHSEPLSPFALRDQVDAAYPDANVHWMMLAPPDAHSPAAVFPQPKSRRAGAPHRRSLREPLHRPDPRRPAVGRPWPGRQ